MCGAFSSLAEKVAIAGCFLKKGMSLIVQSFAQLDPISYLKLGFLDQLILSNLDSRTNSVPTTDDWQKFFPLKNIFP